MNSQDLKPGAFVLAPKGDTLVVAKVFEVQKSGLFASNITVEINRYMHIFAIDELAPIPATKGTLIALLGGEMVSDNTIKIGKRVVVNDKGSWHLSYTHGFASFAYIHDLQRLMKVLC